MSTGRIIRCVEDAKAALSDVVREMVEGHPIDSKTLAAARHALRRMAKRISPPSVPNSKEASRG